MALHLVDAPATPADPAPAAPAPSGRVGRPRRERWLLFFSAPSLIWYLIFTIGPLFAMFYITTLDWKSLAAKSTFTGADNFNTLIHDRRILVAAEHTGIHLGATIPVIMVGAFMLGYFLNLKPPGHRLLRVIMFIPGLISVSSMGMLFVAVLGPTGLVNSALDKVGLHRWATAWLADPHWALPALIGITIWSGLGFVSILMAARLAAIDADIFAAAEIDGAGHWQTMWRVAFPMVIDYFGVLTMLEYLWNLFGSAVLVLLLTRGGPGDATTTLSWEVYYFAFRANRVGYSQAVGLLLFLLGVVGLLIIRRVFRARY